MSNPTTTTETLLKINLFGAPLIALDDTAVSIGHSKATALLAYLAVTERTHTRDALAGLLWAEYDQERARGELRRMLWALNKVLGKGWINADRNSVILNQSSPIVIDVRQFKTHLAEINTHTHANNEICPQCVAHLTQAIELYQDEFLAGFSIPDSHAFETWRTQQNTQLQRDADLALDKLIQWQLLHPDSKTDPIRYVQKRLAFDPTHEATHRLLMAYHAHNGQHAAALQQYQQCQQTCRDELATEPQAATTALYQQIRQGEIDLRWEDLHAIYGRSYQTIATNQDHKPNHNLPAQITPFVGRKAELSTLTKLLNDPAIRLISIVAPGGMGKTRLALQLGEQRLPQFADGVYLVELGPLKDSETIIPAIGEAMGYQFQQNGRSQTQQLLDYLHNKNALLLLDNFEHLLAGGPIVTMLLQSAPHLKIVVTTRQRLQQTGETLFPLSGMGLPNWMSLEDAFNYASISLFQQTARRMHPTFTLTANNLGHIVEICHLVEGMPLGILLAASWLPVLTPQEIVAEIQQGLDILEIDEGEFLERQRSIRVIFDSAWQLLKPADQQAFMKMSIFRGGFTREAAREVAGSNLRQLQTLVNQSLVYRDATSGQYQLHELLRQYAEERLHEAQQHAAALDKHSDYYLTFLAQQTTELTGSTQLATLKRIEADFENIRGAWLRAIDIQAYTAINHAIDGMYHYCYLHSRLEDGKWIFDKARDGLCAQPDNPHNPICQRLNIRFYNINEDPTLLYSQMEMALSIAQQQNNLQEIAFCLQTMAIFSHYVDQHPEQAIEQYEQSAAIFRQLEHKSYLAFTLSKLGEAYQLTGQTEQTWQYVNEAATLQAEIGDQLGRSETLRALSMTAFQTGRYVQCLNYIEEAYTIQKQANFIVGQASSNLYGGWMYYLKGEIAYGRKQIETALKLSLDIADYSTQAWCYAILSLLDSIAQNDAAAQEKLAYAEAIETDPFRQTGAGNPFLQLHINWAEAMLCLSQNNLAKAESLLIPMLDLACQTESRPYLTQFLPLHALILNAQGQPTQAVERLSVALAQPPEVTAWMQQWQILTNLCHDLETRLGQTDFNQAWQKGKSLDLITIAQSSLFEIQGKITLPSL